MSRVVKVLTASFIISLALVPLPASSAAAAGCEKSSLITTGCVSITPRVGNGGVDLGGTISAPGGSRGEQPRGDRDGGGNNGGDASDADAPCVSGGLTICRDGFTVTTPTEGRGPITLADLVNFRPDVGIQRMEPAGWMVIGLDTNFYVETAAHVENGVLLDLPASVRFTPVAYRWDYGDGTAKTTSTGGASWRALGLREFDPTATSHVYRAPGTYVISVSVDFRAEYSFGAGTWTAVEGTVPVPSAPLTARAGDADTVLVARDCLQNPRGPGC